MRWSDPLDVYCERTDPSLWSEPLNAATNLAFLVAAALLWRQAGRGAGRDMRVLILLIAAVGLGSFAFHTIATRWAALLDIGFIAVFVLAFHQRFQVHALGRSNGAANLGVGVFVVLAGLFVFATKQLPTLSQNDSESYLAPFLLLLVCARQAAPRWPEAARWLNRAAELRERCDDVTTQVPIVDTGPIALTRREREIALLAAQGLASKEIGERLFISRRTAENHLAKVYDKLGIRTRSELARVLDGGVAALAS